MSKRLKAWLGFTDGKCNEGTQLLIDDIKCLVKKLQATEEENKILKEAIEYAISQKEQEYGMESVYDIHQFRQRKVFSILEEALEKVRGGE